MVFVTDRQDRGAVELIAPVIVKEGVGLLVPGVKRVAQSAVPGGIEGQFALVVERIIEAGGKLKTHLHLSVIVVQPIAKAHGMILGRDIFRSEIFDFFVDFASQAHIEGGPHGQRETKVAADRLPVTQQQRNREVVQPFIGGKEARAQGVLKVVGFVMPAFLDVVQAGAQGEIVNLQAGSDAAIQAREGTGAGI